MEDAPTMSRQNLADLVDQADTTTIVSDDDWKAMLQAVADGDEPNAVAKTAAERWGLRPRSS